MAVDTWTAFILGCYFGAGLTGLVICIIYRDDIWPE